MRKKSNLLEQPLIKIFVYGTLRKGQRLGFYMEGGQFLGYYFTRGQLMKSSNDNVYIDTDYNEAVTIGEVYLVNYYCLQRINHLEVLSGTFPKGYDLLVKEVWPIDNPGKFYFDDHKKELAFYYKWKNGSVKILTGDYNDDFDPVDVIEQLLTQNDKEYTSDELLKEMYRRLSIYENLNFGG